MTQEDKILLAKAIGESLYSGIICTDSRHGDSIITDFEWNTRTWEGLVYCFDFDEYVRIDDVKPYLRSMSSMTEEEKEEYDDLLMSVNDGCENTDYLPYNCMKYVDWLNSHGFDYRGLIPEGLALEDREDK